MSTTNY